MAELTQMKLLINLARIDGAMAERERNYILNIARANGMDTASVVPLFDEVQQTILPDSYTPDEKFDCILSLVQLMKLDGKLYQGELKYCAKVASKLGYREEVMFELLLKTKTDAMSDAEVKALKVKAAAYLK